MRPSAGTVAIFGASLAGLNTRAGYLFQQDALMPWKTAFDNVAVALEPQGVPRAEAGRRAREWLRRVGLSAFLERYPHMLSGGQRKRVALAQMLIRDPEILLMDEPFGPLDAQTRQIMGNLLLDLWAANRKAVMFVTHDLEEAIALADRVVVMSAGPAARSSAISPSACRGRATSPRCASSPPSTASIRRSGRSCAPKCRRPTRKGREAREAAPFVIPGRPKAEPGTHAQARRVSPGRGFRALAAFIIGPAEGRTRWRAPE